MKIKPTDDGVVVTLAAKESGLPDSASPFSLRRIVVPVDFSPCSRKALRYAVAFAKQFGARLTLVFVTEINYTVGEFGMVEVPPLESQVRAAVDQALARLVREEIGDAVPAEAQTRLLEIMLATKRELEAALPFAGVLLKQEADLQRAQRPAAPA